MENIVVSQAPDHMFSIDRSRKLASFFVASAGVMRLLGLLHLGHLNVANGSWVALSSNCCFNNSGYRHLSRTALGVGTWISFVCCLGLSVSDRANLLSLEFNCIFGEFSLVDVLDGSRSFDICTGNNLPVSNAVQEKPTCERRRFSRDCRTVIANEKIN